MTSRTPLGVQPRPPQRTLSGSGLQQRPVHPQRTLSQQYLPQTTTSPISSLGPLSAGLPANSAEEYQQQQRFAAAAAAAARRVTGSRLKLELSTDDDHFSSHPIDSPRAAAAMSLSLPSAPGIGILPVIPDSCSDPAAFAAQSLPPADPLPPPYPMPRRRGPFVIPQAPRDPLPPAAPAPKRDARPKPYNLDPPHSAPRLVVSSGRHDQGSSSSSSMGGGSRPYDASARGQQPLSGFADFFPWTGDHPEDQFNETAIRQGYFDKQLGSHEAAGARQTICPLLKHKSCLQQLSAVFTTVLTQRRHSGQVNRPSTFKPPPRATLTDSKREAWLHELANPAVPLRKLSRTIPHGIRNRGLLDQCLSKRIPTDRAVWLAKCVGANDMRSFRRKGVNGTFVTGGETKWIRDWTSCVEKFVEDVTDATSELDWKNRVTYAIRLATHLYNDHLLDKDHYMDWLVSGVEKSSQAKLPMWMLISQIYWRDLLRLRKTGRRLVAALLSHIHAICTHQDRDVMAQLSTRLRAFVGEMLKTSPESFVAPSIWMKFRDSLRSLLGLEGEVKPEDTAVSNAFLAVNSRNERLSASSSVRSPPAAKQNLIKVLDASIFSPLKSELAQQTWKISQDKAMIVRTLLEWATSLYRPGMAKIYVAMRLLKTWGSTYALDVTNSVLEFAATDPLLELERKQLFYHLVSELVRCRHFTVARFIKWLIMTRGGIRDHFEISEQGPACTRLLVELPVHSMSHELRNVRGSWLERAGYMLGNEPKDFELATYSLRIVLGIPSDDHNPFADRPLELESICKRLETSSRALKTEVGVWIRNSVVLALTQSFGGNGMQISTHTFRVLRRLLEAAGDYTMMADVIKTCTCVSSIELLASCVDTVNRHLPIFAATGAAMDLFNTLFERLKIVGQEQGLAARPFLASLSSLANRMPGMDERAGQLQRELLACDKHTPVDVASPISDSMMLYDQEGDLHEEIEKLISTGTSLDRPTMERLFVQVQNKLQESWYKTPGRLRSCATLLSRLRLYDAVHFDTLITHYMTFVKGVPIRPPLSFLFPLLISLGCTNLPTLLAITSEANGQPKAAGQSPQTSWCQEILMLVMMPPPDDTLSEEECYRYRTMQSMFQTRHAKEVLGLLRQALIEWSTYQPAAGSELFSLPLDRPETLDYLTDLVQTLILNEPTANRVLAAKWPQKKLENLVDTVANRVLLPGRSIPGAHGFDQVLELANEFTTPFCQLKLSLLSHTMDDAQAQDATEKQHIQLEMFSRAMDKAMDSPNNTWFSMVPCMSANIACFLKQKAERQFLELIPSVRNLASSHADIQKADKLLSAISAFIRGSGVLARTTQLTGAMVDRLADVWEIMSSGEVAPQIKAQIIQQWLSRLVQFLALHACHTQPAQHPNPQQQQQQQQQHPVASGPNPAAEAAAKANIEVRGRLCLALSGILKEIDAMTAAISPPSTPAQMLLTPPPSPPPPPPAAFSLYIYDLAIVLADGLNDEVRAHCKRALRDAASDNRLKYLFSIAPGLGEGLMVARRESHCPGAAIRAAVNGVGAAIGEKLSVFNFRKWEVLKDATPNVGENDTSLSLTLFEAIKQT